MGPVIFERRHNTVICSREDTVSGLSNVQEKTQYHDIFAGRHKTVTYSRQDTVSGLGNVQENTQYRDIFE